MVYNGRPSTGCARCKQRRKKCDETRPSCLRCLKVGRECPGIPDQVDLMFRHETAPVTQKVKSTSGKTRKQKGTDSVPENHEPSAIESASEQTEGTPSMQKANNKTKSKGRSSRSGRQASTPSVHSSNDSDEQLGDERFWLYTSDPASGLTSNPSVEHQAVACFFNNFILRPRSKETNRGFLQVNVPLYAATAPRSPLSMATEAVAVRTAANFPRGHHLMPRAEILYGRALAAAQAALQDSTQAKSDEILLCILLFSLYESVIFNSTENWRKHIHGAVTLVNSRGMDQLRDPNSLLLFKATRTQMLTDAIQRRENIEDFPGPKGWLSDMEDDKGKENGLIEHSVRLPDLLATAKKLLAQARTPETTDLVIDLLNLSYDLQNDLSGWDLNLPARLGYKSVFCATNPLIPMTKLESDLLGSETWRPGPVHIYQDVQVASIRNNNRVSQLLCSSVAIDCLEWLGPESYQDDRRFKAAACRVRYLVDDIIASVPFHLGYRLAEGGSTDGLSPQVPVGPHRNAMSATGGYFLVYPLYISSQMDEIPESQRKWLKVRLHFLARRYGLEQADISRVRAGGSWSGGVD